ncbi:MAG: hypothetical protein H6735_25420 [Alphaproteobacteria bacterium]|nr:hypothetical protein [Alphaproteobacteria bacterium]
MRRWVLLAVVGTPVVVSTIGCLLPGCGEEHAPAEPSIGVARDGVDSGFLDAPARIHTGSAETGGTLVDPSAFEPLFCTEDGAAPSVELNVSGDLLFDYRQGACTDGPDGETFSMRMEGLSADGVVAHIRMTVGDRAPLEAEVDTRAACGEDGYLWGRFAVGMPRDADREDVTLEITVTDAWGHEASTSVGFRARVKD